MPKFDPHVLQRWSGGCWRADPGAGFEAIVHDTRMVRPGSLFVALRGERFDGHDFLPRAAAGGAAGAIVQRPVDCRLPQLQVADTYATLAALARGWRRSLPWRVAAVTGSVGKTTVKDLCAAMLGRAGTAAATAGNWNNRVGLPLSILQADENSAYGVFEIGTNNPGEIAELAGILQPDWALLTPIGSAHRANFESEEDIAVEKSAAVAATGPAGGAVLSRDDRWYELLRERIAGCVRTVSLKGPADFRGTALPAPGWLRITEAAGGKSYDLHLPCPGSFMFDNLLRAWALVRTWGVDADTAQAGLADFHMPPLRWQEQSRGGVEFVVDAYNANPLSMRAAVEAFAAAGDPRRSWLVLGDMLELGDGAGREHEALGKLLAAQPWAGLVAVGSYRRLLAQGAREAGMPADRIVCCRDAAGAASALRRRIAPGDRVLLKGSRLIGLEVILTEWPAAG